MHYILLESGNGRTQRQFIQILSKINGIKLDFSNVDQETMIIASHDSINGNYDKFSEIFIKCSIPLSQKEQIQTKISPTWVHFDKRRLPPACATGGYILLRNGSKGSYVCILQDCLNTLGFHTGTLDRSIWK